MKKKICPHCGTAIKESAAFCPNCGARFVRLAPGTPLPPNGNFAAAPGPNGNAASPAPSSPAQGAPNPAPADIDPTSPATDSASAATTNGAFSSEDAGGAPHSSQDGAAATPPPPNGHTPPPPPPPSAFLPPPPDYDHTAEFDPKDISDNKVLALAAYLFGWIGLLIALLGAKDSPYAAFHARQALKILVLEMLTVIVGFVFFWTCIALFVAGIFLIILLVVQIIAFFGVCAGKAKEPPIVRSFGFLK